MFEENGVVCSTRARGLVLRRDQSLIGEAMFFSSLFFFFSLPVPLFLSLSLLFELKIVAVILLVR